MPHLTSRFTFLLVITSEMLCISCWDISKSDLSLLFSTLYCRPSLAGKDIDIDSPKVQMKNVNKISDEQNVTRLESVVKIASSQENNNIAVTQL